jgi:hypothetical protein
MSNVIAVYDVGNVDSYLREDGRPALFKQFCTGYRLYRLPDQAKVAVVWENVDMAKLETVLASRAERAKKANKVLETIDLFVELEGAH